MIKQIRPFLFILLFLQPTFSIGQQLPYKSQVPDGIYKTKEDFLRKTPSDIIKLYIDRIKLVDDTCSLARRCFIRNKETNKHIKKVFAISHEGSLYFSNRAILDYKNANDKSVSPVESKNSFVRVLIGGNNFLYAEGAFFNLWQSSISAGVSGGVGGIVGSKLGEAIDKSYPQTTFGGTGLVWDVKKEEFNIFRDCSDYNEFIENYSIERFDCGAKEFDLAHIRDDIEIIK